MDDGLLTRLLEQLIVKRHDTAQVTELARRILREKNRQDVTQEGARSRRVDVAVDPPHHPPTRLHSIKAVKEDGTYLVLLNNRSRCVSLTKEAIVSLDGCAAMLTAFSRSRAAETSLPPRRSSRSETTVVEVCARRAKRHQALLRGSTSRRWYSTAQLLLWQNGQAKVDDYDASHPPTEEPAASLVSKEQAYYIDQASKEPLTDPFTLEAGGHREFYNRSSWQSLLNARHTTVQC